MIVTKAVKFIKNFSPYKEGDIAGVSEQEAEELHKSGVVEIYSKNGSQKKSEEKNTGEKSDKNKKEKSIDASPVDTMIGEPGVKK